MIDSIRITHGELDCGTYRVLADFFRTAGIHVYGCVAGKSDKADKFDVRIRVAHTGIKEDASAETADSAEDSDEIELPEIMDKETFEVAFLHRRITGLYQRNSWVINIKNMWKII